MAEARSLIYGIRRWRRRRPGWFRATAGSDMKVTPGDAVSPAREPRA